MTTFPSYILPSALKGYEVIKVGHKYELHEFNIIKTDRDLSFYCNVQELQRFMQVFSSIPVIKISCLPLAFAQSS